MSSTSPARRDRKGRGRGRRAVTVIVAVAVAGVVATTSTSSASSVTDTSPVNLSTPVDMANGFAHRSAVVRAGHARFEVLSPSLVRLEYSPSGTFQNSPTVNVVNRLMSVPKYSARVSGGWLTLRTAQATVRYKAGSGPFTALNTSVRFADGDNETTVHPTWDWECPFDQTCQAGAAVLLAGPRSVTTKVDIRAARDTSAISSIEVPVPRGAFWVHRRDGLCSPSATRTSPVPTPPRARAPSTSWSMGT